MSFTTKTLTSHDDISPARHTFVSMTVGEFKIASAIWGATTPRENDETC